MLDSVGDINAVGRYESTKRSHMIIFKFIESLSHVVPNSTQGSTTRFSSQSSALKFILTLYELIEERLATGRV